MEWLEIGLSVQFDWLWCSHREI